ncbi:MAG: archaeosine biosynthesis radical SAM protein RaSEA [Asgard group archaeon]|nr:archaeosine biosynthesis radical SAM protein RaSEA [Asgard group archaeon]
MCSHIFSEQICAIRKQALAERKERDPEKAIASWVEEDRLIHRPGHALVIILNSPGCSWAKSSSGGCSICGYSNETSDNITAANLKQQVKRELVKHQGKGFESIKLFNSGSFFDSKEIPLEAQKDILRQFQTISSVKEIVVETRPEYVTKSFLQKVTTILGKEISLELGMGLETSDDFIRTNYINKGFLLEDYKKAIDITKNFPKIRVRSYLLLKPPFLTEQEAINDTIQSAIDAITLGSRSISINPVNIQNKTFLYQIWRKGLYRAPWLWSVKEVLQTIWGEIKDRNLEDAVDRIVCDPSGAGSIRGTHNCKKCNKDFIRAIKKYSVSQDPKNLDNLACSCKKFWEEIKNIELATRDFSLHNLEYRSAFLN